MLPVAAAQKHAHAQVTSTIPCAFSPGLRGLLAGLAVAARLISFETKIEQPPPDVEQLLGPTSKLVERKLLQWKQLASRSYSARNPALTEISCGSR